MERPRRILVVDDEENIRELLAMGLRYEGFEVEVGDGGRAALAANTGVFYVVKAAMEYSKSPSTPPQVAVGFLCNLFRRLNNIHPLIPLALIAAVVGALGWATGWAILRLLT